MPYPAAVSTSQARLIVALLGVIIGLISFARVSSWVVKTAARLLAEATRNIASEIVDQFRKRDGKGEARALEEDVARLGASRLGGMVIVDTSSIIDGRILEVAKTGFLFATLLIPDFVLRELQQVADSSDDMKRARGRRGFEIINQLKKIKGLKVKIWDKPLPDQLNNGAVDDNLVVLGKLLKGKILTADFNLNRLSKIRGVGVLSINELANALKTLPIPGEKLAIKISHLGKDKGQGVGYLSDGTMVVVKDASGELGQEISLEVTKIIQGAAGRMVFGKIVGS